MVIISVHYKDMRVYDSGKLEHIGNEVLPHEVNRNISNTYSINQSYSTFPRSSDCFYTSTGSLKSVPIYTNVWTESVKEFRLRFLFRTCVAVFKNGSDNSIQSPFTSAIGNACIATVKHSFYENIVHVFRNRGCVTCLHTPRR